MNERYYHYTSRKNAQSIIAAGKITPPYPGGSVFFTDELYGDGTTALDKLGILSKEMEICFVVPGNRIGGLMELEETFPVTSDGEVWRTGGATQYRTLRPVSVDSAVVLEMRVP